VLGGCFAIVLMAGAATPPCEDHALSGQRAESPHHPMSGPMGGHHGTPTGGTACAVHLCCLHVGAGVPAGSTLSGTAGHETVVGFSPAVAYLPDRTPHLLPFGHAPPPLLL
jgi:hypothetical protein